jgi:hypothetical protein
MCKGSLFSSVHFLPALYSKLFHEYQSNTKLIITWMRLRIIPYLKPPHGSFMRIRNWRIFFLRICKNRYLNVFHEAHNLPLLRFLPTGTSDRSAIFIPQLLSNIETGHSAFSIEKRKAFGGTFLQSSATHFQSRNNKI